MMRKYIIILTLMTASLSLDAQQWTWVFHPGDKMGLPNRYACTYTSPECSIILRSDLPFVRIELDHDSFDISMDKSGERCSYVKVDFFSSLTTYVTTMSFRGEISDDGKICIINDQDLVDYIMKSHKMKIWFREKRNIRIENLDIDANYMSMIYF